jgi:AraC-like DNA-binding protein
LELVFEGSGIVEVNGKDYLFVPADMLFICPRDRCLFFTGPARRWKKIYMVFRAEGAAGTIIKQLQLEGVCHIRLTQTAFRRARQKFASLVKAVRDKPSGFSEHVSALGYELLLIAGHAAHAEQPRVSYPELVKRALRHIEDNTATPLTVDNIARAAGCSRQYLSTLFTIHLGVGVHEWLTLSRINRARRLLETTSDSIEEVATSVGYGDQFHFSRVFRRLTGQSPLQYRNDLVMHRDRAARDSH